MEHAGCQQAGGASLGPFDEVLQRANPARGDHRQPNSRAYGSQQVQIEPQTGAVAVHAGQQDLPRSQFGDLSAPSDDVDACGAAPAMSKHLPLPWSGLLGVDRHDDALAAKFLRRLAHQFRPCHCCRIDAALVGAGQQQTAHVLGGADAATDGQRQEHLGGRARHDVQDRVAVLVARCDIQKAQFVRPRRVVQRRLLDGIPRVAQRDKVNALNNPPVLYVKAWDDTKFQHAVVFLEWARVCSARTAAQELTGTEKIS